MNVPVNKEIKPLHLFIAIVGAIVFAIVLARLAVPHLQRQQVWDDTITIGAPQTNTKEGGTNINPPPKIEKQKPSTPSEDKLCIHVITPAKNLATGEIRDFPTPCDVPSGWEPI